MIYILRLIAKGPQPFEEVSEDNFFEHSITEGQGRSLSGDTNPEEHTKESDELSTPADDSDKGLR